MRSDRQLTTWARYQRKLYHSGALPKDKIRKLEARGFHWALRPSAPDSGPRLDPDENFEVWFSRLATWLKNHGKYPSRSGSKEEAGLSLWIGHMRASRAGTHNGKVSPYRVAKLESLPGWCWDPKRKRWDSNFDAVSSWVSSHGFGPSPASKDKNEASLGTWIAKQREAMRNFSRGSPGAGHPAELDQESVNKLKRLPWWIWTQKLTRFFHKKNDLVRFVTLTGRFPSPNSSDRGEVLLARWVDERIMGHLGGRRKSSFASRECVAELEAIPGWSWDRGVLGIRPKGKIARARRAVKFDGSEEDRWNSLLSGVKKHIEATGKYPSQDSEGSVERAYHTWITRQKTVYSKGWMPEDRAKMLESIPGWQWRKHRIHKERTPKRNWRSFAEGRLFATSLHLNSSTEWKKYCKSADRPKDIPRCPEFVYKGKGWVSWEDWLGTGNVFSSAPGQEQKQMSPSELSTQA